MYVPLYRLRIKTHVLNQHHALSYRATYTTSSVTTNEFPCALKIPAIDISSKELGYNLKRVIFFASFIVIYGTQLHLKTNFKMNGPK